MPPIRKEIDSLYIEYVDGTIETLYFDTEPARFKSQPNVVMNTHRQPVARYMNYEITWTEPIEEASDGTHSD